MKVLGLLVAAIFDLLVLVILCAIAVHFLHDHNMRKQAHADCIKAGGDEWIVVPDNRYGLCAKNGHLILYPHEN